MEALRLILLVIHLLGWAALFGGLLAQAGAPTKSVNAAMRDGVATAFIAGLALTGVLSGGDDPVNGAKIAVKLLIGLVLVVLVIANARKEDMPRGLWLGMIALVIINVSVAVLWSPAHT